MIRKQLNVGDYIFTPIGEMARITKINKSTYSISVITLRSITKNVPFNGIVKAYGEEWFDCDNPTAKALENAFKRHEYERNAQSALRSIERALLNVKQAVDKACELMEENIDDERNWW